MSADNSKQKSDNASSPEPSSAPARDEIFNETAAGTADFRFDKKTASVFDDMVSRSVPFYHEMQRMTGELSAEFAVEGTNLCDLGCATGTTLIHLDPLIRDGVRFVGVDNAAEMISKAREKLKEYGVRHPCQFINADLHRDRVVENASVVIMLLTLQFIRPLYRERVIRQIYEGLNDQGCLIVIEKLTVQDSMFNRLFINFYYEMKRRNGYSEVEISQKREALENVLIPYRPEENRELLIGVGFRYVEEFFRWYNFCGMVAVK